MSHLIMRKLGRGHGGHCRSTSGACDYHKSLHWFLFHPIGTGLIDGSPLRLGDPSESTIVTLINLWVILCTIQYSRHWFIYACSFLPTSIVMFKLQKPLHQPLLYRNLHLVHLRSQACLALFTCFAFAESNPKFNDMYMLFRRTTSATWDWLHPPRRLQYQNGSRCMKVY